jgi:hypothetical protein
MVVAFARALLDGAGVLAAAHATLRGEAPAY